MEEHHGLTGVAHDAAQIMCKHKSEEDKYHPESPARLTSIMAAFARANLFPNNQDDLLCTNVPVRPATDEEIHADGRGHSLEHLAYVETMCQSSSTHKLILELDEKSLYKNQNTLTAAKHSCGACLAMTEAVLDDSNNITNGIVVARPPGHHAEPCACMGFCFYNNVGVSVLKAKDLGAERILIVDWDVHHGNGTQEMFAEDPNVLFISLHRHDNGTFYPMEEETQVRGVPEYLGRGEGIGATVNIAWNTRREKKKKKKKKKQRSSTSSSMDGAYLGGIGDVDYRAAFQQIVIPAAKEFQPDLIFVSAGFVSVFFFFSL
tara:strand:- start:450 stop:1406 length:957 start_codon:yes stop_codon:yes gene_type:complete